MTGVPVRRGRVAVVHRDGTEAEVKGEIVLRVGIVVERPRRVLVTGFPCGEADG